jgi:chemotaxis protein CheX
MTSADAQPRVLPEDVQAICAEVWVSFLGAPDDDPLPRADAPVPAGTAVVCASVSIAGPCPAVVSLELPSEVAAAATRRMLGAAEDEDVTGEDVADAVGELVNMVGGNVKSLLPSGSTLSLPQVVEGPLLALAGVETCAVDLSWGGRPLRVRVRTASHPPDVAPVETSSHPETSKDTP